MFYTFLSPYTVLYFQPQCERIKALVCLGSTSTDLLCTSRSQLPVLRHFEGVEDPRTITDCSIFYRDGHLVLNYSRDEMKCALVREYAGIADNDRGHYKDAGRTLDEHRLTQKVRLYSGKERVIYMWIGVVCTVACRNV